MLKTLRNPQKVRIIMLGTLILIIPAFIIFYGWSSLTGSEDPNLVNYAAKVDGSEISKQTFYREYNRILEQARQIYGENFNEEIAADMNLATKVLEELENKELVLQQAKKLGITVSDFELDLIIRNQEGFKTGGQFDRQKYELTLRSQGLKPEIYEYDLRNERAYLKTQNLVTDFVKVSEPEIRDLFRKENERMTVEMVSISAQNFINQVSVTEQEALSFYKNNQGDYTIPPRYNLTYISVSPQSYVNKVNVTEPEIKEYYDSELSEFTTPERLLVRHILLQVPQNLTQTKHQEIQQKLSLIMQRLQAKEPFEKIAREMSEDPGSKNEGGSLGWVARGDTVPDFEKVAFSLSTGQISNPIQTQFGVHIIKVEQKEEPRIQNLEEVKPKIIESLNKQKMESAAYTECENVLNEYQQRKSKDTSFQEFTNQKGYSPKQTGWFSGNNIPGFEENKELASEIITLPSGSVGGPFKTNDGIYIFQLTGKENSRIPAFEEVKSQVQTRLLIQKAEVLAQKKTEEINQWIKSGSTMEDISNKLGVKINQIGPFTVIEDIPGLGEQSVLAMTAFHLPDNKVSQVIPIQNQNAGGLTQYSVIRIKSREGASEVDYIDLKEQLTQKALNEKKQNVFNEWVQSLRKQAKIKPNQEFLDDFKPKSS